MRLVVAVGRAEEHGAVDGHVEAVRGEDGAQLEELRDVEQHRADHDANHVIPEARAELLSNVV